MSKDIRQMIDKVKNFKQFTNENLDIDFSLSSGNVDKIINFIKSLPNRYKLKTRFVDSLNLYDNGVDTALNSSRIVSFYLKYHKNNKTTTTILPTPELNSELYNKLNDLIKLCDLYYVEEEKSDKPKSLMRISDIDKKSLNIRLFKAMCHQMMNALLYEDYFSVDFRYGNAHNIISDMILPQNEDEFFQLFDNWNNRESKVRGLLFYADAVPIVSTIEKY